MDNDTYKLVFLVTLMVCLTCYFTIPRYEFHEDEHANYRFNNNTGKLEKCLKKPWSVADRGWHEID